MVDLGEIKAAYYMAATGVIVAVIYYIYNMRISQRNSNLALKGASEMIRNLYIKTFPFFL